MKKRASNPTVKNESRGVLLAETSSKSFREIIQLETSGVMTNTEITLSESPIFCLLPLEVER